MQNDGSIADQQRKCHEAAERERVVIDPTFEFSDAAVSGTKRNRRGLNQMLEAAKAGKFKTLFFYNLSRLARESVITMPMLKTLVIVNRVRVISVTEGLDSNRQGWEQLANMIAQQAEQFITALSQSVFRGQEGTILARFSVGDFRFGYTSVPSPGGEVIGRGRNIKPRMVYAINEPEAEWVRRIFEWFVKQRQSIAWIIRELNRLHVPKGHRARTKAWTRASVIGILGSSKYIGLWSWGLLKNVRIPDTGVIVKEERPDDETSKWVREFPELRIITDEDYEEAQRLLDQQADDAAPYRNEEGRLRGSSGSQGRSHLLSGIIQCSHCGHIMYVAGTGGKYLKCPNHTLGNCSCRTQLPRRRAEALILNALGRRILQDDAWRKTVEEAAANALRTLHRRVPDEVRELDAGIQDLERKRRCLVIQAETTEKPDPDISRRLSEVRRELAELCRRRETIHSRLPDLQSLPTPEFISSELAQLGSKLSSTTPARHIS